MKTITLYRPTGLQEWLLIAQSGYKAFPPRLSWQPIFYPVLNEAYAAQITYEWNIHDEFSGYCGIVTRFEVEENHVNTYAQQNVGGSLHNELWVPAESLEVFNQHIHGNIEIVKVFLGAGYIAPDDPEVAEMIRSKAEMY